jgi:hypothetical protein
MSRDLGSIRHQLVVLARSRKTRVVEWSREMPTDWRPYQIRNPITGDFFTQDGAWHFIADLLESGHPIEEIILCQPPGRRAYVMLVELGPKLPKLYIKLQLGSGKVIGRSFHYSTVG